MSWFNRHNAPPQEVAGTPEQPDVQPVDPHAFVESQEVRLADSADAWRVIAQRLKEREAGYTDIIRQGLVDVWVANGNEDGPEERNLVRDTEQVATDLSVYSLIAARHISASDLPYGLHKIVTQYFLEIPDTTVNYIIRSKAFPTKRFLARQIMLAQNMIDADDVGRAVLYDLTGTYGQRPDDISALAGLYEDGVAEVDGRYAELRDIIATDWHHPDPRRSVLRGFCDRLRTFPQPYVSDFARIVSEGGRDQSWATVRDMARFAIVATGGDPNDATEVATTLTDSYSRWDEVDTINSLFWAFVAGKVAESEKQISQIAGPRTTRSIRTYPDAVQVSGLKETFAPDYSLDRTTRRRVARAKRKRTGPHHLPTAASITDVAAAESLREQKPKDIKIVVNRGNGLELADISPQDLPASFKISNEGNRADDVQKMVEWLQLHPISSASERLMSDAGARVVADGRPVKLWRFAPNRVPALNVQNSSRFWRIVYGITPDGIIITDILDHEAFDKKYK